MSCVRAYENTDSRRVNGIGFLNDVRRMNVALTRARTTLWVVGDSRALKSDPNWSALIADAEERGLLVETGGMSFGEVVSRGDVQVELKEGAPPPLSPPSTSVGMNHHKRFFPTPSPSPIRGRDDDDGGLEEPATKRQRRVAPVEEGEVIEEEGGGEEDDKDEGQEVLLPPPPPPRNRFEDSSPHVSF